MSKYKVGDCFVVKIADIEESIRGTQYEVATGGTLRQVVGERFLEILPRLDHESSYNKGMEDAFQLMKRVCNMEIKEFDEIFGDLMFSELFDFNNIAEIKSRVDKYDQRMKFKVGDVLENESGMNGVITNIHKGSVAILWQDGETSYRTLQYIENHCKRTTTHIPIRALLDQMAAKDD